MKKKKEPTDTIAFDSCKFNISTGNMLLFKAFQKYSMYLDDVLNVKPEESVGTDMSGLLNYLVETALTKELKDIQKKHGFENLDDMVDALYACNTPEEIYSEIHQAEMTERAKLHQKILEQIPEEDRQLKLFSTELLKIKEVK